jgi:pimeloyl-ACP methyl ester carboxylesterase
MIDLDVAILPAVRAKPEPDPVFWLEGGPGVSAIRDTSWWHDSPLRSERDLVFVDLRGINGSIALDCDLFDSADRGNRGLVRYLGPDVYPLAPVKQCRDKLSAIADLRQYHVATMMQDLDDVRARLGYDRINLVGASGGSRAALVYLQRYPARVRAMVLVSVVAPTDLIPLNFARDAQRALEGVAAECAGDLECHRAFPDVLGDVKKMMSLADRGAIVDVAVDPDPSAVPDTTAAPTTGVPVSAPLLAEALRSLLYGASGASELPFRVHAAANGDFRWLVERVLRSRMASGAGLGVYFSSTCSEDLPWIDWDAGVVAAQGTFLGTSRLRQQRDVCEIWPRGTLPFDHRTPVRSSVPALLVSGELDPVSPPGQAVAVARQLSNSMHLIVPSAGHANVLPVGENDAALANIDCVARLQIDVIRRGRVDGLDTKCVGTIHRTGFKLSQ